MTNTVSNVSYYGAGTPAGKKGYAAGLENYRKNLYLRLDEIEKNKETLSNSLREIGNAPNVDKDSPIYADYKTKTQKISDNEQNLDKEKAICEAELARVNAELEKIGPVETSKEIDEVMNIGTNISADSPIAKSRDANLKLFF